MCSNPQTTVTDEGPVTFACRVCNECISARKNDWVARVMAERAVTPHALAFDLTYRDDGEGFKPDAAKAFKYKDCQNWLKLVRKRYKKKYNADGEISYIIAGERGSRRGRVHWHVILLAQRPLDNLGHWADFVFKPLPGPQFSEPRRKAKMNQWDLWPHGHVVVKKPTQQAVAYVLQYALKDQFNVVKSRNTARIANAENSGASYFRMSKYPPIGQRYLDKIAGDLEAKNAVLPSLKVAIQEYSGYWYPAGNMREYLIDRLREVNERVNERFGRDAPQWATLVHSLSQHETQLKDFERLIYGAEEEEPELFDAFEWQEQLGHPDHWTRNRCGAAKVCKKCYAGFDQEARRAFKTWYNETLGEYIRDTEAPQSWDFGHWFKSHKRPNPFCLLKYTPEVERAFDQGPSQDVQSAPGFEARAERFRRFQGIRPVVQKDVVASDPVKAD